MATVFAGEVSGTLQSYFASGVLVTASSWAARVDGTIYAQWWSQGPREGPAWDFFRKVSRGLKQGRLEVVYHQTNSKHRCFGIRCKEHNYAVVADYHSGLSKETMVLMQFLHCAFFNIQHEPVPDDQAATPDVSWATDLQSAAS